MSWLDKSCLQLAVRRKDKIETFTFQVELQYRVQRLSPVSRCRVLQSRQIGWWSTGRTCCIPCDDDTPTHAIGDSALARTRPAQPVVSIPDSACMRVVSDSTVTLAGRYSSECHVFTEICNLNQSVVTQPGRARVAQNLNISHEITWRASQPARPTAGQLEKLFLPGSSIKIHKQT